ncbi:unnamed protein product [Peniophora sp. CBMAI 1063]|nr:unnamed protein product [Peniophora sp. CBMAI 1063]
MAEIYIRNIPYNCDHHQLTRSLAEVLHQPPFAAFSATQLNFRVHLMKDKRGPAGRKHKGMGFLTLPRADLGELFLQIFGTNPGSPSRSIFIERRALSFEKSKQKPKSDIVEDISRLPYQDPAAVEEREKRTVGLSSSSVAVSIVQFGWECRDDAFSIEWEKQVQGLASLTFSEENREMRVHIQHGSSSLSIVVRHSSINDACTSASKTQQPEYSVWMSLSTAPHFEQQDPYVEKRRRLQCLPFPRHGEVVGFVSHSMRVVFPTLPELHKFRRLADVAQMHQIRNYNFHVVRRELFSAKNMDEFNRWQKFLHWEVAYQIEGILRRLLVDVKEMLTLMQRIRTMIMIYNSRYTAAFLKVFRLRATNWWFQDDVEEDFLTINNCFTQTQDEFVRNMPFSEFTKSGAVSDPNIVQGLHVSITPTSISLDGPFPEQNNRVLRSIPAAFHENFLRVSFMEEGKTQFRFDRDIDGRAFIEDRVGTLLRQGLTIAGRKFDFLAYSMSALKEHTVWFLQPFSFMRAGAKISITAPSIIASLGTFDRPTLYCPARYAARISQAFTATDQATVEVEEVEYIRDVETADRKYCFTDGVGTISLELARKIWADLQATRKRVRRSRGSPRAYQVRFQGSKGMLSVDYRLRGSVINLRPSMKKFEAPDGLYVEIARAFDSPGAYYLNRPLIMLLEGLGVPYSVFERYQDAAVLDVERSTRDIAGAGRLFEKYGLGASFRVSSVLNSLAKLGLDHMVGDEFYRKVLEFAVNHILRDLKNHARIPIPKGHTLVGVADVHGELKENEIYACVRKKEGPAVYLEGPILVSRSPTIHPGDAQIAHAIGKPKRGSSFEIEPLPNMVVFSTKGARPLPTCLGGGDLDGDLYNLIPLNDCPEFRPKRLSEAASYDPAPKKVLDRPSTMNDVADFVVDYINSDVVGIIAINWLIIADQSERNIFDPDCMTLSQLHSDAVDYQKSGTPVALDRIPRLKFKARPDWNAPETVNVAHSTTHYKSQRAIGKLFRKVELPTVNIAHEDRRQRRRMRRTQNRDIDDLASELSDLSVGSDAGDDPVVEAVRERVDEFIDIGVEPPPATREAVARLFQRYAADLQGICATQVLSHRRTSTLTEEEAVVGTIVEKTSQPRKRKEVMAKLREHTDYLVKDVRTELAAAEDEPREAALMRGWLAWQLSVREHGLFGARSFGWVALGSIFETIKDIEDEEKERLRNLGYD